ncbi:ATP-dependent bile acid permease [Leucoagaricus sp. SymC.cos]|nr:ATP-dependent bile acid permease [Leucoagaricus sp. SymC.cos]
MDDEYIFWYRNPLEIVKNIIQNSDFVNKFNYISYHEYIGEKHCFQHFMSGDWLFTEYFPHVSIYELLSPDILHQLIKGTFKDHFVTWIEEYIYQTYGTKNLSFSIVLLYCLAGEKEVEEGEEAGGVVHSSQSVPLWRIAIFVFVEIVETLCWSAYGSYPLYDDKANWWRGARVLIYAVAWLYTVIKPGRSTTLNEEDVWDLSPTLQSHSIFVKFSQTDLDFTFTLVSVVFNYAGPFFLKQILDEINHETTSRASRSKAYVYAFFCTLYAKLSFQADVRRLWFGRRAPTRIRSELMAAIYEEALKRKDYSGIIDKSKIEKSDEEKTEKRKAKKKAEKGQAAKAVDPKAGADVGRSANPMAGDANRAGNRFHLTPNSEKLITIQISQMASGLYFLYGAPFEIAIAGTMLYKSVLLLSSSRIEFHSQITRFRRSVRIQKGVLAAAIALFSMISFVNTPFLLFSVYFGLPLNIIPTYIIQVLQTRVALERVSVYLDEDEDSGQASAIPEGELTIVTGSSASGKTTLLMALLGEMTTVSGRIIMRKEPSQIDENGFMHSISYAAQSPLRHQSIKDSILFGDSHTLRFLYEHLLRGPLLVNRTVIFVTHHVELVLPERSRDLSTTCLFTDYFSGSYWTWIILGILIIVTQLLGVGEKFCVKVRFC